MLNWITKLSVAVGVAVGVAGSLAPAASATDATRDTTAGTAAASGTAETISAARPVNGSAISRVSASARGEAVYTPTMTVSLTYDDKAELVAMVTEWSDSLPIYTPTLRETATGTVVGIETDYAESVGSSDLEGPHKSITAAPLTVGTLYDYTLRVQTTGFWHCSIYDPDGCSFLEATDTTYRWRFTWNGSEVTAATYVLPKANTAIKVSKARKSGKHGWKFTATLLRDGKAVRGRLYGQYEEQGRWRKDDSWVTNSDGKLTLRFYGIDRSYRYKLLFKGTSTSLAASSKPVRVPRRR